MIVAFGNIGTSLFAGFVIFAIIGYLAQELNMKVEEVVDQGRFIVEYQHCNTVIYLWQIFQNDY